MADPVQPTEEAVYSAARKALYDSNYADPMNDPIPGIIAAITPLLRREVAAEIRNDEMVKLVANVRVPTRPEGGWTKALLDAVATRIEGPSGG